jgi:hypothetical protein
MMDQNPCPARSPLDSRRKETVTICARDALTASVKTAGDG